NKRRLRARKIEKNLLAQNARPDRLVPLEAIPVERVVPARLGVNVFASRGVTPIVRLLQRPAIRHHIENVGDWRQNVWGKLQDVVWIGIQPVAKLTITPHHSRGPGGQWRTQLRL